jgi:putative tryptophan/tyrosine transport system substrate-binding protein
MAIYVGRREFIAGLGGTVVGWPLAARAQQPERVRRIGVLSTITDDDPESQDRFMAFQQELQKASWTDGRNVRFERRTASDAPDDIRAKAAELVALAPDVILTASNLATATLGRLTRTIPIVFATAGDPVGTGLVTNMARPGGNITGFATYELAIGGKWLELLKEIAPSLTRVGAIYTEGGAGSQGLLHTVEPLARSMGIRTTAIPARDARQIEGDIGAFSGEPNSGLITLSGASVTFFRKQIVDAAAQHRLPAIYFSRYFVTSGGLMSYAADVADLYRLSAAYVDRILRGEKPGELPVQAPTKYELVVNLKTAKALGLTVPQTLLATADEVIE